MKEKFIIIRFIYCTKDNSFNVQGECSTLFMIDKDGKFEFDSEAEAIGILQNVKAIDAEVHCVYEIRKIYTINKG